MPYNILLVDDHPVFLKGLRAILDQQEEFWIVGEANNGLEAVKKVHELLPNLVIIDINMPELNGIEATQQIKSISPHTNVLALSIHSGKRYIQHMVEAGASGYLLKESAPDELLSAIAKIREGQMYFSAEVTTIALSPDSETEETPTLFKTLLQKPNLSRDILLRERLIRRLEENKHKSMILVSAPAGYGKSILIAQWLEQEPWQSTWINLTEDQNQISTFFWYVYTALESIVPGKFLELRRLLTRSSSPDPTKLNYTLSNELLNLDQDIIIVLDNFHFIGDKDILKIINNLLQYTPPRLHLVIITRRDPSLKISALRSTGGIHEIRVGDIRYTKEEIAELYKSLLGFELNQKTLNRVESLTEGWIVGLRLLSTLIGDPDQTDKILGEITHNFHLISDYLLTEILSKQTPETQEILLKLSLLSKFNRSIIDDLLLGSGTDLPFSGEELIQRMMRSNLFVTRLDNSNDWFRFHNQFKQILQNKLKSEFTNEEIKTLVQNYQDWYQKMNLPPEVDWPAEGPSQKPKPPFNSNHSEGYARARKDLAKPPSLSEREKEVIGLVAQGLRNKEIAAMLFISTETVKKHLYNIFQKIGVKTRTQMIHKAKNLEYIQ